MPFQGVRTDSKYSSKLSTFRLASRGLSLLAMLAGLLANPGAARAVGPICRVDPGASGSGSGGSWANAMTDLQTALTNASCTEIWVHKGTYKPGTLATDTFNVQPGVKVFGGFHGNETQRDQRGTNPFATILLGDIDNNDTLDTRGIVASTLNIHGTNSLTVVTMDGTVQDITRATVLDGFVISGGDGTSGGGLYCNADGSGSVCSPTLRHVWFWGNRADSGGAVVFNAPNGGVGKPELTDVHLVFNEADAGNGGAMLNTGSNGGNASPVIKLGELFANKAAGSGGAMYNDGSSGGHSNPLITQTRLNANSATAGSGGAIFNNGDGGESSPTIRNSGIWSNYADEGGGMMNWATNGGKSSPQIIQVSFVANGSGTFGGAIYNYAVGGVSSPQLRNNTFRKNTAGYGGAMFSRATGGTSKPWVLNTIMWNDTATNGNGEINNVDGALPKFSHSLVKNSGGSGAAWDDILGIDGGGNLDAKPWLSPLTFHGGHMPTITLRANSPALDAGRNAGCPSIDTRGVARPQDFDGDGIAVCDMGTTERLPPAPAP